MENGRRIDTLLFDLDGTLYPVENGYIDHMRANMFSFMEKQMGIKEPEVIWRPLFKKYNQSAKALRVGGGYHFDLSDFWAACREGASSFISEAPAEVKATLESLTQDKYIFTNCNEKEAEEVLHILGIRHHFKKVYGAKLMGDYCKPDREAFDMVMADIGANPQSTGNFGCLLPVFLLGIFFSPFF
ncbi:unnamed protein product [Choristocarpus tenellus]